MVAVSASHFNVLKDSDNPAESWLNSLTERYNHTDMELLSNAVALARELYGSEIVVPERLRFEHAIGVGGILADIRFDAKTIAAGILYAAKQQSTHYREVIQKRFGEEDSKIILRLVEGVAQMAQIQELAKPQPNAKLMLEQVNQKIDQKELIRLHNEGLRKILLAMVEDIRVVLIKLAERTQLMRVLNRIEREQQIHIAQEVSDIFAPLANRLGVWQMKWELEDLAFRYLDPETYKRIAKLLDERRVDREEFINNVINTLKEKLAQLGIEAEVTGRPKHIYSIYNKMRKKGVDFDSVYDVRAVRVLVPEEKDCYSALGIVHSLWTPISGEFDDYIAKPKNNNYQSLHTAVRGPKDKAVEVQIRTHEMHEHAEFGVAAHWRYKEGTTNDDNYDQKIAWLRRVLDWQEDLSQEDDADLAQQFRNELFKDTIYVLTPRGQVIELPKGATAIDFAYHVHTELGHRCRGAKIDGKMIALNTPLESAQRVQIIAAKEGGPSRDWLNEENSYVRTLRARNEIRHWFNDLAQANNTSIANDKEIKTDASELANAEMAKLKEVDRTKPPFQSSKSKSKGSSDSIAIEGVHNVLTTLAKCCKPVPFDPIVAYLAKGRGAIIHRHDCPNLTYLKEEQRLRLCEAKWGDSTQFSVEKHYYAVDIQVEARDRHGLLHDISNVFTRQKVNVTKVNTLSAQDRAKMCFTIEISSVAHLKAVLEQIRELPDILQAERLT